MLPFTPHGRTELIFGALILAVFGVLAWRVHPAVAIIPLLLWIWLLWFFRDPHRPIPADPTAMVSPADGTITDITELDHDPALAGAPAVRVGIFLSVFSVHVNRSPCDGVVSSVTYKKGKFVNALKHGEASAENESNLLVLAEHVGGAPLVSVKQIVGLIARRIVCTAEPGDRLSRGERFGMIKFGSRTELTVAKSLNPKVNVGIGQKVRGGSDVIMTIGRPIAAEARS